MERMPRRSGFSCLIALIRGALFSEAISRSCSDRLPATVSAFQESDRAPASSGGFAPIVLHAAVYFVANSADFEDALNRSMEFAGPANYCPVLVGAIGGARWGSACILPERLHHCADILPELTAMADLFVQRWRWGG